MDIGGGALTGYSESSAFGPGRRFDYYVDGAVGSDSNDGSISNPFRTIQRGINMSDESNNPGDNNIFINPGTYFESLSISDDDLVRLIGRTGDPYAVQVRGVGAENVLTIDGGRAVHLRNMRFTNGLEGVSAYDLGYLKIVNVVANLNQDDGLDAESVNRIEIFASKFKQNGDDGADLQYNHNVGIWGSHFRSNLEEGLELVGNNAVSLYNVRGIDNGDDGLDAFLTQSLNIYDSAFNQNWDDGADLENNDYTRIFATAFNMNRDNGVELIDNNSVELISVRANQNGFGGDNDNGNDAPSFEYYEKGGHGVSSSGIDFLKILSGQYVGNYHDGAHLEFSDRLSLLHTTMKENGDDGVEAENFDQVYMRGGIYRDNWDHGANFSRFEDDEEFGPQALNENGFSTMINAVGGLFWENGNHGFSSTNIYDVYLRGISAQHNNYDGVDVKFADSARLVGSDTMYNGGDGASFEANEEVRVSNLVSKFNGGDGLNVDGADEVYVNGGVFWENDRDGINLDGFFQRQISNAYVSFVNASHNRQNGLSVNDAYDVSVRGGVYLYNGDNGIRILDTENYWSMDTVSQFNGQNGLLIFNEIYDDFFEGPTFFSQTHVRLIRGNYSFNGVDGIQLVDVGMVSLEQTLGLSNDDDGLDVFSAISVDLGGSTFANNGDQDVTIV